MNYVQPIKSKAKVDEVERILDAWKKKYRIMYLMGIYSGLRISDILPLKVRDVYGRDYIDIREKKTKKAKRFRINKNLAEALEKYCTGKPEDSYLIPSGSISGKAMGSRRAYEVIRQAGEKAGVSNLGTHSMRKTFGYHYYRQTGDIVTLQKVFNHSTAQITMRYIGIDQEVIDNTMYNFDYKS